MRIQKLVSNRRNAETWICTFVVIPQLETRAEWVTEPSKGSNPLFSFRVPPKRAGQQIAKKWEINVRNAYEVRREFLAIRKPEQAKVFFQTYGPMQTKELFSTEARPIRFSSVMQRRVFYDEAFTEGTKADHDQSTPEGFRRAIESYYLNQNLQMEFSPNDPEFAIVRCKDVEDCLRATFALDKKKHYSLRYCAREKCGKTFRLGRDKRKIYCSEKCARLQAQHDYLDRLDGKTASAKRKGK